MPRITVTALTCTNDPSTLFRPSLRSDRIIIADISGTLAHCLDTLVPLIAYRLQAALPPFSDRSHKFDASCTHFRISVQDTSPTNHDFFVVLPTP